MLVMNTTIELVAAVNSIHWYSHNDFLIKVKEKILQRTFGVHGYGIT